VSYAGIALIVLALALFVAEFLVPGFGILTGSGVVALILGSIMLMDTDVPFLQISWTVLVPMSTFAAAMGLMMAVMAIRAHRRRPVSGEEGMIGRLVTLEEALAPEGHIWLEGESWRARAPGPVPAGARVRVVGFEGLLALVEPVPAVTPTDKETVHG